MFMAFTVFYAWQSDRDEKVNHYLIRDALQDAIDAVVADLRIEEAPELEPDDSKPSADEPPIELDWATKDEPGTPNVAQAIFRKISECGVFLADLTYVAEAQSADGRRKFLPNSNVMIELGQASASVGWKQVLLVMNKHFGGPEHLPFDLKNYAFPVTYDLPPIVDKKTREAERKKLAKAFEHKLRIIQKSGLLAKKAESAEQARLAAEEEQEARAQKLRDEFDDQVRQKRFRNVRGDRGVLSVVVTPAVPPKRPLVYGPEHMQLLINKLVTVEAEMVRPDFKSDCVVASFPNATLPHPQAEDRPKAVAVLTDRGTICGASNLNYHEAKPAEEVITYGIYHYQPRLVRTVLNYLTLLRELGVGGPWYVGLSFLKWKNSRLALDQSESGMDRAMRQVFRGDDIKPYLIRVPADADLSSYASVLAIMKPAFDQFWKEFGFPRTADYTEGGEYKGWS